MSVIGDILGDSQLNNLISKVDNVLVNLNTIPRININNDTQLDNTIKTFIDSESPNVITDIFSNITVSAERINRYSVYDELYKTIQIIKKVIKIYQDYILQKDLVSGKILIVKENDKSTVNIDNSKVKQFMNITENFIKYHKIKEELQRRIIPYMLRYGDYFIEIVDLLSPQIKIPKYQSNNIDSQKIINRLSVIHNKHNNIIKEDIENSLLDLICEVESPYQYTDIITEDNENSDNDLNINYNRIIYRYHKPHNVVVVKTSEDEIVGYIITTSKDVKESTFSPTYRFASLISQLYGASSISNDQSIDRLTDKLFKLISKKIIASSNINFKDDDFKSAKENEENYQKAVYSSLKENDFYTLKRILFNIKQNNAIDTKYSSRFVPVSHMIQFTIPNSEYYPYGMSIIDPIVYPAKLYLLHQLSNIVIKLSRAAVIRKWTIETGPRDIHSDLLNKLKRELRNQRTTVDDIMSFKTLPKVLSDFKDLVLFSKKGQKFLDVEVQSLADTNSKISDLEDARRELISLSGVPASFLGFSDVVELRDQLISININFAMEIAQFQELVCAKLCELFDKTLAIYNVADYNLSDISIVHITPPTVLMLQLLEATIGSISNILSQTQQIKGVVIDPITLLKQYIPYINWDDLIEKGGENIIKSDLKELV